MQYKTRVSQSSINSFLAMWKPYALPKPSTSSVRTCLLAQQVTEILSIFWARGRSMVSSALVANGRAFHILLANLSEGSSHEGDQLSSCCIVGRSQHKIVLLPSLALLWELFLVLSLRIPRLKSLSCLLLLRSRGSHNCISKCELGLRGLATTPHADSSCL